MIGEDYYLINHSLVQEINKKLRKCFINARRGY